MAGEKREVWARRVKRWRESGQTTAAFAAEIGVNPRTLAYWRWKLGREGPGKRAKRGGSSRRPEPSSPPSIELVELIAPESESSSCFEVICSNGMRVRIPDRFEAEALSQILSIVRRT